MSPSNVLLILSKQVDLLYRNIRLGQITSIVNASFLVWVAYLQVPSTPLAAWWVSAVLVAILRIRLANTYIALDEETRQRETPNWRRHAIIGAGASGLIWGAGALLLMLGNTMTMQLFTAFVMAGMIAGAIPVLAADHLAFRSYAWPIVLAVTIGSLGTDRMHLAFSMMTVLFMIIASRSADYFHGALQDTFRLEHEKDILVKDLQHANQVAENSNRAKTEFLANVSHELRTPMNGIIGMTELLEMENLSDDQRAYLTPLRTSADELLCLINHMIQLSALESGQIQLSSAPFAVPNLLDEALSVIASTAREKGLGFHLEHDPALPTILIGDFERLIQVLQHLVSNAVKFTNQGKVSVTVRLAEQSANEVRLSFTISDTGPGIAPDKVQQLRSGLFVQADGSVVRRHGGTGIGLPIARKLIERMGGKLEIESSQGVGSTFSFTLPFKHILPA